MKLFLFLLVFGIQSCKVAQDAVQILCSSGHIKNKMTVGLDSNYFSSSTLPSDEDLSTLLNDALTGVGINSESLSVSGVESVSTKDKYRFLQLGGSFASGFGIAGSLISNAFKGSTSPFLSMSESFSVNAAFIENDPDFDDRQWAHKQTNFSGALELIREIREAKNGANNDNEPVIVAILDTGVDSEHPDLVDIMIDGEDFSGSGSGTADENGHGTHCAGIVASQRKEAESPLGVAGTINIKIMPIKVLGKSGGGGFQAIEKGVRYAMQQGVDVISMSLGAGIEYSDLETKENPLQNAIIKEAIEAGIIVVVAAGNESCQLGGECEHKTGIFPKSFDAYTVLPCANEGVICIGATSPDETLASYSNYQSSKEGVSYRVQADINAPGTNIYSTWPTNLGKNYNTISGTSMATPYVAGIAALFKWADRSIDQATFKNLLVEGQATPINVTERAGSGRVDLYTSSKAFQINRELSEDDLVSPVENIVEDETGDTNGDSDTKENLVSDLWGAVCQ